MITLSLTPTRALVFAVCCAALALPATADQLLGLPFGTKLVVRKCPFNTDKAKAPCWISTPFVYAPTGGKSGTVYLPNPDSRPAWASYAIFKLFLAHDNTVEMLRVETIGNASRAEIVSSVSQRFGQPAQNLLLPDEYSSAKWRSAEGGVDMTCSREACYVDFMTPTRQAAHDAEMDARRRAGLMRPTAP